MTPEVGHLHEVSVAVGAVIRLLSRMQSHVCFQMVVPGEPLVALRTLERLLASVRALVVLQHVFVPEGSIADTTRENLLSVVLLFRTTPGTGHYFLSRPVGLWGGA